MAGDYTQYQSISSSSFNGNDFNERPKFINAERLKELYGCAICNDVVVQPHQTPCGNRVCKECMNEKFDNLSVIKCPLPHDDMDEKELKEEQCQQEGLSRDAVVPDSACQQFLLKEKCFCENQEYGCCENLPWKKLKEHQAICVFVPDRCPNKGCYKLFAKKDLQRHTAECEFGIAQWKSSEQYLKHKDEKVGSSSASLTSLELDSAGNPRKNDFADRPRFINSAKLKQLYSCAICKDVAVQPFKISCGSRVCKDCIYEKFGSLSLIKCPLPHDDIDKEKLKMELCQLEGLVKEGLVCDTDHQKFLLEEKCFCENQEFGCPEKPLWKELEEHQAICVYIRSQCPNQYCTQLVAKKDLESHLTDCEYALDTCSVCKRTFKHKDKELMIHQKSNPECLRTPGRCYYFEYCGFQSDNLNELKAHMENNTQSHIEAVTAKLSKMQSLCESVRNASFKDENRKNEKIKNLVKYLAQNHMQLKALTDAAKSVSQGYNGLESRLSEVERRVEESSIDRRGQYEHSLQETFQRMDKVENSMKTVELCSYDGDLLWKINDYKRRKSDAVRGRQMSIYSHPFYTSRHGYKMRCHAYLNGDGLGRGKCLSLFFVLMRGEYDELLHFPFKQRVTFSLLCPSNPSLSKHETFLPDPDSSSFRRPQTEMNIASGCPQFALHADVESSNFLVNDCIYVQVKVEPGGEKFPKEKRNTELS